VRVLAWRGVGLCLASSRYLPVHVANMASLGLLLLSFFLLFAGHGLGLVTTETEAGESSSLAIGGTLNSLLTGEASD
jgi:hypothetical protein